MDPKTTWDRLADDTETISVPKGQEWTPKKTPMKASLNINFEGTYAEFTAWVEATFRQTSEIQIKVTSGPCQVLDAPPTPVVQKNNQEPPKLTGQTPADALMRLAPKMSRSGASDLSFLSVECTNTPERPIWSRYTISGQQRPNIFAKLT